ncbi:MAG: multicopper oxidase family protein [Gammaproteobacteria bacterium]|nr:multicopper oxidase family protein [Gammaproteobacteria bacterium]
MTLTRRHFLLSGLALGAGAIVPIPPAASMVEPRRLIAAPARARLLSPEPAETEVWAYDGSVPGPVLRARVGDAIAVTVENALPQPTTVHWHGLRVPNAMDGVPHLTQAPIAPGAHFTYAFPVRNSGTFWYHPHFRSAEQLDRGLHGVIIVDEEQPPAVDRDLLWVLDDWRLDEQARIVADFDNLHDASHQGRFGNTNTVNGRVPTELVVRAGERVRLRLVNVANAWIFGLDFKGHRPRIIAFDGHAVAPHEPPDGLVVVGPAQRVDIVIDMTGSPDARHEIVDRYYPRHAFKLMDVVYESQALRSSPPSGEIALPAPALPQPDTRIAARHEVLLAGGAMGGMRGARYQGRETGIRELAGLGKVWAINGVVASRHDEPPQFALELGATYRFDFVNDTAFPHPMHLHGHPMKLLEVDGRAPPRATWRDTWLLPPRARASVAVVADNPGQWMLHCHIPEHMDAGMMAVVSVG